MIDLLITIDRRTLFFVNHLPHTAVSDAFFLFFSVAGYYGLIWFLLAVLLFLFYGLNNNREIKALILTVLFEIIIVEFALKNLVLRIRPESVFSQQLIRLLAESKDYSFPSGHATIAFAGAYILTRQRPKLKVFFYLLATLVALSRVYLGKHYPSDVFAGAITGLIIGFLTFRISKKLK